MDGDHGTHGMDHRQVHGVDHSAHDMSHEDQDHGQMHGKDAASQSRELPPAPDAPTRPGHGNSTPSVGRSLTYADLRAAYDKPEYREPDREIEIRLGGNMERFIWTINGKKFSEAEPIQLRLGERVRFKFINEDMMNHPMHLHGMWMEPVNGQKEKSPRKHVVNIPPGQTYSVDINVDAPGDWAFHCHLMYHMDAGMFTMVTVAEAK
jgi:L-ascorbate oxidase